MKHNVKKDILAGKSTDFIVSKYLSKETSKDDVLKIVRMIKYMHYKTTGEKLQKYVEIKMTEQETKNNLSIIWDALHDYRENCIPQYNDNDFTKDEVTYDEQWDEICGAMANITEQLGLDSGADNDV